LLQPAENEPFDADSQGRERLHAEKSGGNLSKTAGQLTAVNDFVPIRAVKFFVSLLLLSVFASTFSACTTDANRRDLYSPKKGSGYWTDRSNEQLKHRGIFGVSNSYPKN